MHVTVYRGCYASEATWFDAKQQPTRLLVAAHPSHRATRPDWSHKYFNNTLEKKINYSLS
jgi:hypothetical protein